MDRNEQLKTVVIVTERGKSHKIAKHCPHLNMIHVIAGKGTADSDVMSIWGFGETEKDVIIAAVAAENVQEVFACLVKRFRFDSPGKGIAFTIPVTCTGGMVTLQMLYGKQIK